MIRVGIAGATGYTGAELVRLLATHPQVRLTYLASRQHAGKPFSQVYPAMYGIVDMVCGAYDLDALCDRSDVIFTALPHKLPMEIIPRFIQEGKKVIDLSADFRFKDVARYEAHYQPHCAKELVAQSVYGLSELYADAIRQSKLVGNPGCYPTSILLPLVPLIREKLVDVTSILADSKSGVSGAGRSLSLTTHYCEVNGSFKAYKVGAHRHTPEIEEVLSRESGQDVKLTFVPHLVPMTRGMLSTIYLKLTADIGEPQIRECLNAYYADKPFVRILEDRMPDTLHVKGTNYCDIGFKVDPGTGRLIVISVIDNLVKGASGQAVQNMNIMCGFAETEGLGMVVPAAI